VRKQQLTSFYLEALLLVVAFVAMIAVLTGVFGASLQRSKNARQLTQAVTLAANAAEAVSASDDLEQAAALLDEGGNVRVENGRLEAAYLSDGRPCADGAGALRLTLSWEASAEDPALVESRIDVFAADDQTPIYTLETARWRKGATP
jgi:type II secretory pathway pseudopilin PulG